MALRALVLYIAILGAGSVETIDLYPGALTVVLVQLLDNDLSSVIAVLASNGEVTVLLASGLHISIEIEAQNVVVAITLNGLGHITISPGALVNELTTQGAVVGSLSQLPSGVRNVLNLDIVAVLAYGDLGNNIAVMLVGSRVVVIGLGDHVLVRNVVELTIRAVVDLIVAKRLASRRMVLFGMDPIVLVLTVDRNNATVSSEYHRAERAHHHQNRHNKSEALFETKFHGNFLHRN
jgi:hypothetical protein